MYLKYINIRVSLHLKDIYEISTYIYMYQYSINVYKNINMNYRPNHNIVEYNNAT
jgi:hypothetical protein